MLGVNLYPNHLTSSLGWKGQESRDTGIRQRGEGSFGVRQWISSVLGIEKERPSLFAFHIRDLNLA